MKKIILLISFFSFLLIGCKSDKTNIELKENKKAVTDSMSLVIDSLNRQLNTKVEKEIVKEKSFEDFVKEYIRVSNESKEYYLQNSKQKIQIEIFSYFFPIKDEYNISRKESIPASKLYAYLKSYFEEKYNKNRRIENNRIIYKMGGKYELVTFLFKKDEDGNWKFYKLTCPEGELEPNFY